MQLLVLAPSIPPDSTIYVTDNGYLGNSFRSGEGTLKFTATTAISAGTTLAWVSNDASSASSFGTWEQEGSFSLSTSGDQIYVYTFTATMEPNFVFALQYRTGVWDAAMTVGVDDSSTKGALPSSLSSGNFAVALAHKDNKKWDVTSVSIGGKGEERREARDGGGAKEEGGAKRPCRMGSSSFCDSLLSLTPS